VRPVVLEWLRELSGLDRTLNAAASDPLFVESDQVLSVASRVTVGR
jgi:hypothetical protein